MLFLCYTSLRTMIITGIDMDKVVFRSMGVVIVQTLRKSYSWLCT